MSNIKKYIYIIIGLIAFEDKNCLRERSLTKLYRQA